MKNGDRLTPVSVFFFDPSRIEGDSVFTGERKRIESGDWMIDWLLSFFLQADHRHVCAGELPTTCAWLRGGGFKRLVCVRPTVSRTQEPFTLSFVPKVPVLAIFYPIRWLTPTDIHLPLSLRLKVGDFFRKKDVKRGFFLRVANDTNK
ncbi:hypothetical protein LR69_03479 [Geobacillus sp. BCO2]|nr:hypothetical protein LR69_03479 [Geobacillus sp. BCO2]